MVLNRFKILGLLSERLHNRLFGASMRRLDLHRPFLYLARQRVVTNRWKQQSQGEAV